MKCLQCNQSYTVKAFLLTALVFSHTVLWDFFSSGHLIYLYKNYRLPILFVINSLDHTSLQYGMKSQSPKEKLDPGKQDSLEDLRRYSFIKTSTFMETYPCSSLSTVKF